MRALLEEQRRIFQQLTNMAAGAIELIASVNEARPCSYRFFD